MAELIFKYKLGSVLPYCGFIRIFLKSEIYSLTVGVFLLLRYFRSKEIKDVLLTIINLIPPFISFTRSFWLSFVLIIMFWLIIESRLPMVSKRKAFLGFILLLVLFIFFNVPLMKERLVTSFSNLEAGNQKRAEQMQYTFEKVNQYTLFGMGPGGQYYHGTYAIESTYHDALARYGIVGFMVFIIFISLPLVNVILRFIYFVQGTRIINYFFLGYLIIILTSITNPFLISSLGMLYLGLLYGIMVAPEYQIKKIWMG